MHADEIDAQAQAALDRQQRFPMPHSRPGLTARGERVVEYGAAERPWNSWSGLRDLVRGGYVSIGGLQCAYICCLS